ncbi:MAG: copper homeostasis protein CutC [Lachnospiraceae bacterium]|nr:copper homeostasis protein CutC [Lachnospiraceae bacterium]
MKKKILEACVDSVESALAAVRGGADRLELCANLIIGGTTPGPALFREIKRESDIRIHTLIRPRFGDFCYTDYEFRVICEEVRMFRELGADGVVIGILTPDGRLNQEKMGRLMELAGGMSVTLHRAFDVCRDPFEALEQAKQLGIHTVLTSGQRGTCAEGKELLREFVREAGNRIEIMAGSGVNAEVIREVAPYTGVRAFHMSGKSTLDSLMVYRKEGVSMGLPLMSEFVLWRTSEEKMREARKVLDCCPIY